MQTNKVVVIYTDGACLGNPGPGGWAALLKYGQHEKMISGAASDVTNNQMELTAAIEGLEAVIKSSEVCVYTDSTYVKNGISEWITNWKKKGWRTSAGKPVKNKELWQRLDTAMGKHSNVQWKWVKAHAGNVDNERVDTMARAEAEKIQAKERG